MIKSNQTSFYWKRTCSKSWGSTVHSALIRYITKTRLYNFDLLKPHFYIVKLGFTEAVLTSTHNLCFEQKYENIKKFYWKSFLFLGCKNFNTFEKACFRNEFLDRFSSTVFFGRLFTSDPKCTYTKVSLRLLSTWLSLANWRVCMTSR